MTLVLIHIGKFPLPDYFNTCLNQAIKYFDGVIHVIIPRREKEKFRIYFPDADIITHFQEDFYIEPNALLQSYGEFWEVTFSRLLYLEKLIQNENLTDVIHIENDVLLYADPENFINAFRKNFSDRVAVNPIGENYASFAYCYIPEASAITALNQKMLNFLSMGKETLLRITTESMINEMIILQMVAKNFPDIVGFLPSLPYGECSRYLNDFGILFDPASYGQYIGGTGANNPGWTGDHHYIGRAINQGAIRIIKDADKYFVLYGDRKYQLMNLHVHSKELSKYADH